MKNLRVHCLAKVLNNDDRKILQDITGFNFVNFSGNSDTLPNEVIQKVYEKVPEETLHHLFEKYRIVDVMPYDGKHSVVEEGLPKPNVQLCIYCEEPYGGAAALGSDGKWYWTFDMQIDYNDECEFKVTHWTYLA